MFAADETLSRNGPETGDYVVVKDRGRWGYFRYRDVDPPIRPRSRSSREPAIREAGRLALEKGVRLFVREPRGGLYRWVRISIR